MSPSRHATSIKESVITCGLTNVRVINKVIKTVNRILGERTDLSSAVLARTVPSLVLLSAIHYRGIDDGPTFEFVLSTGGASGFEDLFDGDTQSSETMDQPHGRWRLLLTSLGIHSADAFESLVVQYLESGLFDKQRLDLVIDKYVAEVDESSARQRAHELLTSQCWDQNFNASDLIAGCSELLPVAGKLEPYLVTSISKEVSQVPGGAEIGEALISQWVSAFKSDPPEEGEHDDMFNRPLHPAIKDAIEEQKTLFESKIDAYEACIHVLENRSWGMQQILALNSTSQADYEQLLRTLPPEKFRKFLFGMIGFQLHPTRYNDQFVPATNNFVLACRHIVGSQPSPRLAAILLRAFEISGVQFLLTSDNRNEISLSTSQE